MPLPHAAAQTQTVPPPPPCVTSSQGSSAGGSSLPRSFAGVPPCTPRQAAEAPPPWRRASRSLPRGCSEALTGTLWTPRLCPVGHKGLSLPPPPPPRGSGENTASSTPPPSLVPAEGGEGTVRRTSTRDLNVSDLERASRRGRTAAVALGPEVQDASSSPGASLPPTQRRRPPCTKHRGAGLAGSPVPTHGGTQEEEIKNAGGHFGNTSQNDRLDSPTSARTHPSRSRRFSRTSPQFKTWNAHTPPPPPCVHTCTHTHARARTVSH